MRASRADRTHPTVWPRFISSQLQNIRLTFKRFLTPAIRRNMNRSARKMNNTSPRTVGWQKPELTKRGKLVDVAGNAVVNANGSSVNPRDPLS
jgi:hypothetical protein